MSKYNPIHLTALELESQLHLSKRTNMTVKLLLKKKLLLCWKPSISEVSWRCN